MKQLKVLRQDACSATLFAPVTLGQAMLRLGFVQADPIRSPARAQDLILRHRVKNYRAGDLEDRYPKLRLEEDFLYAYGFMTRPVHALLHPRLVHPRSDGSLSKAEEDVLALVSAGKIHPKGLEKHLGREREINAWGGYSKATTRVLERLQYRGLLRISHRESGIRVYETAPPVAQTMDARERLRILILLIARLLAPVPERSLRATMQLLARGAPGLEGRHSTITELIDTEELTVTIVDQVRYLRPAGSKRTRQLHDKVRFLAPFDPIVWDRRRFDHLWGWRYRFEAYTPAAKRQYGYYAMPVLWRTDVVGWVNVARKENGITVEPGYILGGPPREKKFVNAFDEEVDRLRTFLVQRKS